MSRSGGRDSGGGPGSHWDRVYREKDESEMSWTEPEPRTSLSLLRDADMPAGARVLDVGGGMSRLVDRLLDAGFRPGVLDVSAVALERARARLGKRAGEVVWIRSSVLDYRAEEPWAAWHDRATFHFLTDPDDRRRYVETLESALAPAGVAVLATFGPGGPRRCSGLEVQRYGPEGLTGTLGSAFALERSVIHRHRTPWGDVQQFLYARVRRHGGSG